MKTFEITALAPRPKRIELLPRGPRMPRAVLVRSSSAAELSARARKFQQAIARLGHEAVSTAAPLRLRGARDAFEVRLAIDGAVGTRAEAYRLLLAEDRIEVAGRDAVGVTRGLQTLVQILRLVRAGQEPAEDGSLELPGLAIEDEPSFASRGLMIDVSRTRVPTRSSLFALVEKLAELKLNQLQLYTEHTFAYEGHERVWRDASPITPDDVLALDLHCRAHDVELVPNQQSFGHLHRWLVHEPYRALAEVPEGIEHAFSRAREPYGLCPTDPGSLALLEDLYDQLLPHFTSATFNVGCDETVDLGAGRSREACERLGPDRVYLDFLLAVAERVRARGKRPMFWGDILVRHPELVPLLPRDAIALEWGYDAGHPFDEHLAVFAASGLAFDVCPGTSSWQSLAGRTTNALANVREAARAGERAGARGVLVTDWGDRGHLQPPAVAWPGIVAGASLAWNARDGLDHAALAARLDAHVFEDRARVLGRALCELGDAYLETGSPATNGSALFFLIAFAEEPLPHARLPALSIPGLARTLEYVVERRVALEEGRPGATDGAVLQDELRWVADLMAFACRLGIARLETPPGASLAEIAGHARKQLVHGLAPLIVEHRRLWGLRSRPGGLDESAGWLERVRDGLSAAR